MTETITIPCIDKTTVHLCPGDVMTISSPTPFVRYKIEPVGVTQTVDEELIRDNRDFLEVIKHKLAQNIANHLVMNDCVRLVASEKDIMSDRITLRFELLIAKEIKQ